MLVAFPKLLFVAVFALSWGPGLATAQQPAPTREELGQELAKASERYIKEVAVYQCEKKGEDWDVGVKERTSHFSFRSRQLGKLGLMVVSSDGEPSRATGVNSRYSFEVKKSPGKEWVLAAFHENDATPKEVFPMLGAESPICRGFAPYWFDEGIWLPDFLQKPPAGARIGPLIRASNGRHDVVRISFEFPHRHAPDALVKGHVDVVPSHSWIVSGWLSELTKSGVTRRTGLERQYSPDEGGLVLVRHDRRVVTSTASSGKGRESSLEYLWTKEKADPEEFRLTAFGLPEPPGVKWERSTPPYVWVLIAAAITMSLAILFRRLARRRARLAAQPSAPA